MKPEDVITDERALFLLNGWAGRHDYDSVEADASRDGWNVLGADGERGFVHRQQVAWLDMKHRQAFPAPGERKVACVAVGEGLSRFEYEDAPAAVRTKQPYTIADAVARAQKLETPTYETKPLGDDHGYVQLGLIRVGAVGRPGEVNAMGEFVPVGREPLYERAQRHADRMVGHALGVQHGVLACITALTSIVGPDPQNGEVREVLQALRKLQVDAEVEKAEIEQRAKGEG